MEAQSQLFEVPPLPPFAGDILRWQQSRARRRLLEGTWHADLERVLRDHFGPLRRQIMGRKSMGRNQFARLCRTMAANYVQPPMARHAMQGELPELLGRLPDGRPGLAGRLGLWPRMVRYQQQVIGLREMALRVDYDPRNEDVYVRSVTPDCLLAWSMPEVPDRPVHIWELLWSPRLGRWTWHIADITDLEHPRWAVMTTGLDGRPKDTVEERMDGDYPYRRTQGAERGRPVLPYVLHHAQPGACGVWDAFQEIELVEATLDIAAAYTFLQHALFRASWPQRWGLDVMVAGTVPTSTENGTRSEVPTDPTSLLHLQTVEGAKNPQIGQWGAGIDPVQLETAVERLERALGDIDGMAAGGLLRQSSDPMSAEALIIQQQGQRTAQVRYGAVLRQTDEELLGLIANVANLANLPDRPLPEDGYEVEYRLLSLSPTEQAATIERLQALQDMGLLSPIDAYCELHPGTTRVQAAIALKLIEAERAAFPPPKAPTQGGAGAAA